MSNNEEIGTARYYANPAEQQILIQGLHRYFSLPERSQNRNKIAKEVSQFLRCFSPHWSHRAVRLWFNNNKHTYVLPDGRPFIPPPKNARQGSSANNNININNYNNYNNFQQRMNVPIKVDEKSNVSSPPVESSPNTPQMPVFQTYNQPLPFPKIPTPKISNDRKVSVQLPVPTQNKEAKVTIMPPIQIVTNQKTKINDYNDYKGNNEKSKEDMYIPLSVLLNDIRHTQESDQVRLQMLTSEYDKKCFSLKENIGNLNPQLVAPTYKFLEFPIQKDQSIEHSHFFGSSLNSGSSFNFNSNSTFNFQSLGDFSIPDSLMSFEPFADFPSRNPSFDIDSSKKSLNSINNLASINTKNVSEQNSSTNIWQSKNFQEVRLSCFDTPAFNSNYAGYTCFDKSKKMLSLNILKHTDHSCSWKNIPLNIENQIKSMVMSDNSIWLLDEKKIYYSIYENYHFNDINLPQLNANGKLSLFKDGVAATFNDSPNIIYVSIPKDSGILNTIQTKFQGINYALSMKDGLICGIPNTTALRFIDGLNGYEIRSFVGHCDSINGITSINENCFASSGNDSTVRIWDIRDRDPISSIIFQNNSISSMFASNENLFISFHTHIGSIELKKGQFKPLIAIKTDDYVAASMHYKKETDILSIFCNSNNNENYDNRNEYNPKYVFRQYSSFLGVI